MRKNHGPYSPIKRAGNFYFISGQLGADPKTKKAAADIAAQTRQALKNLKAVLAGENLSFNDLVKTTVYLANIDDFPAVNKIYEAYFETKQPKPARSCAQVSGLPKVADKPLLIEIEAVAWKDES